MMGDQYVIYLIKCFPSFDWAFPGGDIAGFVFKEGIGCYEIRFDAKFIEVVSICVS